MVPTKQPRRDRSTIRAEASQERLKAARLKLLDVTDELLLQAGLNQVQVQERRSLGLVNIQDFASSRSILQILRSNVLTLFNAVVGASFILLLLLGEWKDALFGFAVVFNILIGIVQEYTSKRTLDRLAILNAPFSRVLRGDDVLQLHPEDLVLDDLLELRPGDQISADAKLLASDGLLVDESLLSGEAEPVAKSDGDLLMAGSGLISGTARARVVRIGPESYGNRITLEARRYSMVQSELRNALRRIIYWISWLLLPVVAIALNGQMQAAGGWASAVETGQWRSAVVGAISGVIAMIPQGLVLITSISFALSAVRLSRKNVLIQELPAVEGLARVDVVCFDKTGTLTEGAIVFDSVQELGSSASLPWRMVLAHFANDPDANTTASSLRGHFESADLTHRNKSPFSSLEKWSAYEFEGEASGTWVLGAPEFILNAEADRVALTQARAEADKGKRVLALAHTTAALVEGELPKNLSAVSLILLREQVRADAAETLRYFAAEGVGVRIISGDSPATVAAVAREAGLEAIGAPIDGRDLPGELGELAKVLEQNQIFGRVTPEQKREMVKALQLSGHVVAMTGDGVNDALALKVADLGIAMGSGSAITKAVSRLVLLDGKFATLPSVVAEGRRVIANIERISRLFLSKTVWAISLAIVFGVALWTFPFLPRQLSAIDGFTIGLPAFALALLPNHKRYVPGFLRRSLAFCIPAGLLVAVGVIVLSFLTRNSLWTRPESQTSVSLLLALAGLWILVTLARPLNTVKVWIWLGMVGLFVGLFTWQLAREFFGFELLDSQQLLVTLAVAVPTLLGLELAFRLAERVR